MDNSGPSRRLIMGNWKAGCTTRAAAAELTRALAAALPAPPPGVQVVLLPPFTALEVVSGLLPPDSSLGAQDIFWEDAGAYTGTVTGPMLTDLGCSCALVGHSERRRLLGETDEQAARKILACRRHGLLPVLCVGESLDQREAGQTEAVLRRQVGAALADCPPGPLAVAYEPLWAVGTGRAATTGDCAAGLEVIRAAVAAAWPWALRVPCLYGGSVTAGNCAGFWHEGTADGALIGGASLRAEEFAAICRQAAVGESGGS